MPKLKYEKQWKNLKDEMITEFIFNRRQLMESEDNSETELYLHAYDEMYSKMLRKMDYKDGTNDFENVINDMKINGG
ncbi:hypothetical protein [Staphylococcus capitis]|uniref:hypothetical protein n=1 Tax=Staphylococcus capitis TaxID=29388 RepID=UPI00145C09C5|nr:hypothetical protein [Staphylococcus capitis]MEB5628440.1 hypothetical protein [Staphylococcus capitis]NMK90607.1 hypothetical protein [Staphylococcus capitis]NMK92054.1 hypothetical protein [Staphylococcus capitis]